MRMYPTDLSEGEWACIAPLLPQHGTIGRPTELDLRQVVNALLYWERTNCPWRMLPKDFPPWTSVRYYFDKWTRDGTWQRVQTALQDRIRQPTRRRTSPRL